MEIYKCYECNLKFKDVKYIISHLKLAHSVKEKVNQIQCVNCFNSYVCTDTFLTFRSLRSHLSKCCADGKKFDLMVIIMKYMILIDIIDRLCFQNLFRTRTEMAP